MVNTATVLQALIYLIFVASLTFLQFNDGVLGSISLVVLIAAVLLILITNIIVAYFHRGEKLNVNDLEEVDREELGVSEGDMLIAGIELHGLVDKHKLEDSNLCDDHPMDEDSLLFLTTEL